MHIRTMKCQIHNMIIHIIHLRLDGSCTSRQHPLLPKAALCHICHGNTMVTPWNQDEQEEHTADHQGLGRQRSSSFRCWARIFAENSAKNKACQWASHGNKSDSKTNMGNAKFGHPQRGLHDFQWCDGIVLHQHWVRYCEKARCIHIYWSIRI